MYFLEDPVRIEHIFMNELVCKDYLNHYTTMDTQINSHYPVYTVSVY